MIHSLILFLNFILVSSALASSEFSEISPYYLNARSMGMGGAHLGLSDDENALYQNPAGLAQEEDAEVHLLPLTVESTVDGYKSYSDMQGFNLSVLDQLAGNNIYMRGLLSPQIRAPGFAFGFLWDEQIAFFHKNRSLPELNLGWQSTKLLQFGTGFSLLKSKRSKRSSDLRVGFAGKYFWRRGGVRKLSQPELLQLTSGGGFKVASITGDYEPGIDLDIGMQYRLPIVKGWTFGLGAAWVNVGDGIYLSSKPEPAALNGNLGLGFAFSYENSILDVNIAYDIHYLQKTSMDFRKKNHLGLEVKLPIVSVYMGLNQVYFTYGLGFRFGVLNVHALSYTEELASYTRQIPNKRLLLKLELSIPL